VLLEQISHLIKMANPYRDYANLSRRSIKLIEELGEVAEAWLSVTSPSNGKMKTWDDVREEIADCLIVALDIAWTALPGEEDPEPTIVYDAAIEFTYSTVFSISYRVGLFGQSLGVSASLARREISLVTKFVASMALQALPDQAEATSEEIEVQLLTEVERKLAKWAAKRAAMAVETDDV
jgi:NTP pyrophosphatase (non-canonical NTP hydrolase)